MDLRVVWAALMGAVLVAGGGALSQQAVRPWLTVNGHDWSQMRPDVRLAYIDGFLAGAALSQASSRAGDTAGVRAALEQLSRNGGFRFPYAANVYESRMNDFYWWKNHLPLPTWSAFLEVNTTLGRPISDSTP